MSYSLNEKKIWVTGHNGMVSSVIKRRLLREDCDIITIKKDKLDLRDSESVLKWMKSNKPQMLVVAAAKVVGIYANSNYPAELQLI